MRQKVFRVQDGDGQGPYTGLGTRLWGDSNHVTDTIHPSPREEGLFMTSDHVCCFESLEDLHVWFSDNELKTLKTYNFGIVELEVEDELLETGLRQSICVLDAAIPNYLEALGC